MDNAIIVPRAAPRRRLPVGANFGFRILEYRAKLGIAVKFSNYSIVSCWSAPHNVLRTPFAYGIRAIVTNMGRPRSNTDFTSNLMFVPVIPFVSTWNE